MHRVTKCMLVVAVVALICGVSPAADAEQGQFTGVIIGRTGEFLQISVPQPVKDGAQFAVKLFEDERPIADVKVVSCTEERPFVALAKVIRKEYDQTIPIGIKAYADPDTLGMQLPAPKGEGRRPADDRFSVQAGVFYPRQAAVRESTQEYWQSYRLNYSMFRAKGLETMLSVEYGRADSEGGPQVNTTEVVPVTLLGKVRPMRMGNARVFLAAGAGMYGIRLTTDAGGSTTKSDRTEMGLEYGLGIESDNGWVAEVRYRDVENTDIQGYSFALGARF